MSSVRRHFKAATSSKITIFGKGNAVFPISFPFADNPLPSWYHVASRAQAGNEKRKPSSISLIVAVTSRAQAGNENVVAVACMVGLGCISPVAGNEKMERTSRCDSAKISEGAGNASMNMGHGATPPKAACSDAGGFSMPTIARQMERMRSFPHFQSGNRDFRGSEYKKISIPSFAGFLHSLPASGMM